MLVYILVSLSVCASLAGALDDSAINPFPCMHSNKTDAYKDFLNKHVRSDAPTTLDQNQWQTFIRNISTCNRTIQSFLPFSQKQQVDNVCSASGSKVYNHNLCISDQVFNFTTVYVDNNCIVTKVVPEKKHIILACDELQGYCLPVHFQANPKDDVPNNKSPGCKNPNGKSHAHLAFPPVGHFTLLLLSTALTRLLS